MKRPGCSMVQCCVANVSRQTGVGRPRSRPRRIRGIVVVKDGDFVGVAAPTSYAAEAGDRAFWRRRPSGTSRTAAASDTLFRISARTCGRVCGKIRLPRKSRHQSRSGRLQRRVRAARRRSNHARRLAEWADGKLTVWTGTQGPFRVKGELQGAFGLATMQCA